MGESLAVALSAPSTGTSLMPSTAFRLTQSTVYSILAGATEVPYTEKLSMDVVQEAAELK